VRLLAQPPAGTGILRAIRRVAALAKGMAIHCAMRLGLSYMPYFQTTPAHANYLI